MAALWQRGGQRLGDLSEMTSVEISTLSRLVGVLQRRGLLSRTRPDSNARTVQINLTKAGRALVEQLIPLAQRHEEVGLRGFVNYLFGIGVALVGIASWLALEGRRRWIRVPSSSLVVLACFFSHIAAFGFYTLVIIGVELLPAVGELRARQWPALGRRIAIGLPQFVAPAVLWLSVRHDAPTGTVSYAALWRKVDLLFSVFDNYNRAFDVVCFTLFLALIGGLLWTRRLGLAPRLAAAVGIVFAFYLLLPSQIYSGSGADHRLPTGLFLLLVAATAPRFPSSFVAAAVGLVAALVLVVRLGMIERVWRAADQVYSADLVGIDALPQASKLAIAYPADLFHVVPIPEVHL